MQYVFPKDKTMIKVGDKLWIDSRYTYIVCYYYDENNTIYSIDNIKSELCNYIEFPYFSDAKEYIELCIEIAQSDDCLNNSKGKFLFQIIENPIKLSTRYTNELPLEFNYN